MTISLNTGLTLDALVVIACILSILKTRRPETTKISGCIIIFIAYATWFNYSGNMIKLHSIGMSWFWYASYAIWLSTIGLFCKNQKSILILFLGYSYCIACSVLTQLGSDFLYDTYPIVIFLMNICLLYLSLSTRSDIQTNDKKRGLQLTLT